MKKYTIERKDDMGHPVFEHRIELEPHDYETELDRITRDFDRNYRRLISQGLPDNEFIFLFRAEKDANGKLLTDRFFLHKGGIAQPQENAK